MGMDYKAKIKFSYEIYSYDIFVRLNESFLIEGNRNIMID